MTMKQTTLEELTKLVTRFRAERDWAQFHTPKELAISLVVESAELLELMQWKQGEELTKQIERKREAIEDELGDVLHSVLLLAHDLGLDLAAATKKKLEKVGKKYPVEKARGRASKYDEL
jgi:dCTP diphosphatase